MSHKLKVNKTTSFRVMPWGQGNAGLGYFWLCRRK